MPSYITAATYTAARTGGQQSDLPSGEIDNYIARACDLIDQWCGWTFAEAPSGSFTETLYSGPSRRVVIGRTGYVLVRPAIYPLTAVNGITWTPIVPVPLNGTVQASPQTVPSEAIKLRYDRWQLGDGCYVFQDLSTARGAQTVTEWNLDVDGGFASGSEPDWLVQASILMTSALLKRRGGVSVQLTENGPMLDTTGGRIREADDARDILMPHKMRL